MSRLHRVERKTRQEHVDDSNFYESMPLATPMAGRNEVFVENTDTHVDDGVNRAALLAERIVSYIVGVVEVLLGLRLLLTLFSYFGVITTASGFARFIYNITQPLVAPFASLFNTAPTDPGAWTIAFAMLIYAIIGYGIVKLIQMAQPRSY